MEPLLEVTRGNIVESLHRGAVAVVTPRGRLLASVGDVERICFLRSAAKPLQVLPFVASGGAERLGVTEAEIALMAGSHGGEAMHTNTVEHLLARVGLTEAALCCGSHAPFDEAARRALGDRAPRALHNNCSGKHAGMLAAAVDAGHSVTGYLEPEHFVQRAILSAVSRFSDVAEEKIETGIDGCSAPIFALSVRAQALMFARLVNPVGLGEDDARAARRISAAMVAHPEMVAATEGRIDTDLMRAGSGQLLAKAGAEGVYAMGIFPSKAYPDGVGVALKIEDGDPAGRARDPIVAEIVSQLLGLELALYAKQEITNRSGTVVGTLRPVFSLERR
jgi:L-asparaginase II